MVSVRDCCLDVSTKDQLYTVSLGTPILQLTQTFKRYTLKGSVRKLDEQSLILQRSFNRSYLCRRVFEEHSEVARTQVITLCADTLSSTGCNNTIEVCFLFPMYHHSTTHNIDDGNEYLCFITAVTQM